MKQPVCVLGLGLIGGSVLRAAQRAGRTVWGYQRSAGAAATARAAGFDASTDLPSVLGRAADAGALIVIAVPMPAVPAMLAAVKQYAPDCPLTDVVSVKRPVRQVVSEYGLLARYVGGHPMAGTADSGWGAADPDLFRDAAWVITADDGCEPAVWRAAAQLALDCGATVVPAGSGDHDEAVARISHLPHVLAEALAIAGADGGELALGLAAGSFRDGVRVAGTSPDLVRAMCEANSAALSAVLDETIAIVTAARDSLRAGQSLHALTAAGHTSYGKYARRLRSEITEPRLGEPGWAARLRAAAREGGVITQLPPPASS